MTGKQSVDMDYQADEAWVLDVQRRLYQQSKANPDETWRDLWGWLTDDRMIRHAWRRVSTNKGKRSARGVDNREVRANRVRKSVGAENTFTSDLTEFDVMLSELQPMIDKVWRHCEEKGSRGRTVTLKVKFNDFEVITRSRSVPVAVSSRGDLERLSIALLQNEMPVPKPVRLLGVSLSALQGEPQAEPQLGLPI